MCIRDRNPSDAEVDQIGREIDEDGNGEIDFEEFLSIMKSDLLMWDDSQRASLEGRKMHLANFCEKLHKLVLKGKLGDFFLFVQSFYRPKTKTSVNRQFSPKSPKIGQKSGQRVRNSPNKDQVASDLLWESINSGFRPTVGIHQFWLPSYCGNPFIYWSGFPQ